MEFSVEKPPVVVEFRITEPFLAALRAGNAWLQTEQPKDAAITHHGIGIVVDGWCIEVIPQALSRVAAPLFVFKPALAYEPDGRRRVISRGAWRRFKHLVGSISPVIDFWNGDGCETGSIAISTKAHRSLLAAEARYRRGCRKHPRQSVFCNCDWFERMRARLIVPEGWS